MAAKSLAAGSIGAHNSVNAPVNRPSNCIAPQAKSVGELPARAPHRPPGDGATE
jgi:hypothetical protein